MNCKNITKSCFGFLALPLVLTAEVVVNLGSYDDASYAPYLTGRGDGWRVYEPTHPTFDVDNSETERRTASIGLGSGTFGTDFGPLSVGNPKLSVPAGYSGDGLQVASILVDATGDAEFTIKPLHYHRIMDDDSRTLFQHSIELESNERSSDTSFASVFFYEKADFLSGASSSIVSFADGNGIAAKYGLSYVSGHGRMIIKDSGSWYVSDAVNNGTQTLDSNSNFYAYNLESDLIIKADDLLSVVPKTASDFKDIQAVGIHMQQLNFDSTDTSDPWNPPYSARQFFDGFSANLTVTPVPERSAFSWILSVCVVTFLCLRRRASGWV